MSANHKGAQYSSGKCKLVIAWDVEKRDFGATLFGKGRPEHMHESCDGMLEIAEVEAKSMAASYGVPFDSWVLDEI